MARGDHRDARRSVESPRTTSSNRTQGSEVEGHLDLDDLKIDRAGEVPIGVQLAWALRARIGDKRLAPGQRLPGLRELAEMVGINANTARAVYQRLEQEGLIESLQGTGTFVAEIAHAPSIAGQIAADAAQQARRTGVDPREVAAALYVTGESPVDTQARSAERRRELRAQIAALEQTFSEMQARHPGLIQTPSKPRRHAGPRLLSVEDLEAVRGELVRRLAAAEPLLEAPREDAQHADAQHADAQRGYTRARKSSLRANTSTAEDAPNPDRQSRHETSPKTTRRRPQTRPSTA